MTGVSASSRLRVVVDTNVLISALVFQGLPGELLDLALAGAFLIVTSPALLDELDEKLRLKFMWSAAKTDQLSNQMELICDVISTVDRLAEIKEDPDDDRVLECAMAGRADCIVSGDRHLLNLGSYRGISILTVRQFMSRIRAS